jgi:hypothetical protein
VYIFAYKISLHRVMLIFNSRKIFILHQESMKSAVAQDVAHDVARDVAHGVARDVARDVAHDVTRDVAHDVARGVARDVAHDVARDVARCSPTDGYFSLVPCLIFFLDTLGVSRVRST